MNFKQFSVFEPIETQNPSTNVKLKNKKQKQTHSPQPAYPYNNQAKKLPIYRNPNPMFDSQTNYPSEPTRSVNSRAIVIPPTPTLVKLTNTGKLNRMLRNNQPGMMVFLK